MGNGRGWKGVGPGQRGRGKKEDSWLPDLSVATVVKYGTYAYLLAKTYEAFFKKPYFAKTFKGYETGMRNFLTWMEGHSKYKALYESLFGKAKPGFTITTNAMDKLFSSGEIFEAAVEYTEKKKPRFLAQFLGYNRAWYMIRFQVASRISVGAFNKALFETLGKARTQTLLRDVFGKGVGRAMTLGRSLLDAGATREELEAIKKSTGTGKYVLVEQLWEMSRETGSLLQLRRGLKPWKVKLVADRFIAHDLKRYASGIATLGPEAWRGIVARFNKLNLGRFRKYVPEWNWKKVGKRGAIGLAIAALAWGAYEGIMLMRAKRLESEAEDGLRERKTVDDAEREIKAGERAPARRAKDLKPTKQVTKAQMDAQVRKAQELYDSVVELFEKLPKQYQPDHQERFRALTGLHGALNTLHTRYGKQRSKYNDVYAKALELVDGASDLKAELEVSLKATEETKAREALRTVKEQLAQFKGKKDLGKANRTYQSAIAHLKSKNYKEVERLAQKALGQIEKAPLLRDKTVDKTFSKMSAAFLKANLTEDVTSEQVTEMHETIKALGITNPGQIRNFLMYLKANSGKKTPGGLANLPKGKFGWLSDESSKSLVDPKSGDPIPEGGKGGVPYWKHFLFTQVMPKFKGVFKK